MILGEPPSFCVAFRRYVTAMCVTRGPRMIRSLLDLSTLPNGNWQNHSNVEIYIPRGTPFDKTELLKTVADRMTRALIPGVFTMLSKDCTFHVGRRAKRKLRVIRVGPHSAFSDVRIVRS